MQIQTRRSTNDDLNGILQLINEHAEDSITSRYESFDPSYLNERSLISIVSEDKNGKIIGYAAFSNIPSSTGTKIDPISWQETLSIFIGENNFTYENTLWLSFLLTTTSDVGTYTGELIKKAFYTAPEIENILFVLPKQFSPFSQQTQFFEEISSTSQQKDWNMYKVYICKRKKIRPALHVRIAKVEDHDDLVPIFNKQSEVTPDLHSQFVLAKIIADQSEDTKTLVAEVNNKAVGIISITTNIQLDPLQSAFYLERYGNLVRKVKSKQEDEIEDKIENKAFTVTLFCLSEEYNDRAIDFLKPAFEHFPNSEYMIVTLPHSDSESTLFRFMKYIPKKSISSFPHVMYLTSRMDCMSNVPFVVKIAEDSDIKECLSFLSLEMSLQKESTESTESIINTIQSTFSSENKKAVVAYKGEKVVGCAVVSFHVNSAEIRSKYEIEDYIVFGEYEELEHCLLESFFLDPEYENKRKLFVKEILRITKKYCMYYQSYDQSRIPILSSELIKVQHRRKIQFLNSDKTNENYALYFCARKKIYEPRININTRIVVVGASTLGISFLETLSLIPYMDFTNLKLISDGGIPSGKNLKDGFISDPIFEEKELSNIQLKNEVEVVEAKMESIDRKNKCVQLTNGTIHIYDYLILTSGLQETIETRFGSDFQLPNGVYSLDNELQVSLLKSHLQDLQDHENIIIYGYSLNSYCAIASLLEMGYSPSRLLLVFPHQNISCFGDSFVDSKMDQELNKIGVQIERGTTIHNISEQDGISIEFISNKGLVSRECGVLLFSDTKGVDLDMFNAIIDSSLVFNGRLVINEHFITNDNSIYSLGGLATYSHAMRIIEKPFECYNSRELGIKLAGSLLNKLDPVNGNKENVSSQIQQFNWPKTKSGYLPGHFYYFQATIPHDPSDEKLEGRSLITTRTEDNSYLRLQVDEFGYVISVTYLGRTPLIEQKNYTNLIGLHEKYMNNLISRFDEGIIPDLREYFQDTWAMGLFHDRFNEFNSEIRKELLENDEIKELMSTIKESLDDHEFTSALESKLKKELNKKFQEQINLKLFNFLQSAGYELSTMYFTPPM